LAVALIAAAAIFIWRGNYDASFVTAVLGICSFFLGMRFRLKSHVNERLPDAASADEEAGNGESGS
jgi:hypothetical protein